MRSAQTTGAQGGRLAAPPRSSLMCGVQGGQRRLLDGHGFAPG